MLTKEGGRREEEGGRRKKEGDTMMCCGGRGYMDVKGCEDVKRVCVNGSV